MEELFNGNIIFVFFFAMIAIYNYSDLKEYQRIAIIYITVYSLVVTNIIGITLAIILLFLTMFFFLEILTKDEMKFKIIVNPLYKMLDCLYLAFFQYSILEVLIAVLLCHKNFKSLFYRSEKVYMLLSVIMIIIAVTHTLQQKYVINSFNEMYRIFADFPINRVKFNHKLEEVCQILVSIEDRTYYERKGYTFLSIDAIICILKRKVSNYKVSEKIKYTYNAGKNFVKNVLSVDRGYSTIPKETYQDKQFIVIWCPGGETRPYSSPKTMDKDNKERIHYIRKSSNSVMPTDDEEKDLFNLANRVPFDDRINHEAEISDLNITLRAKQKVSAFYEFI